MTDRETSVRIAAQVADLEAERDRLCDEARRFVAISSAVLNVKVPDWTPATAEDALRCVLSLREELLPILEAHFPHLLKPEESDANAVRQQERAP